MKDWSRKVIDALKNQISFGSVPSDMKSSLLLELGKEIDRRKVYNEPSKEIEELYQDALSLNVQPI